MTQDNWTQETFFTALWTDASNWSLGSPPTNSEDAYVGTNAGSASVESTGNVTVASIATSADDFLLIEGGSIFTATDGTGPNDNVGTIRVTDGSLIVGHNGLPSFIGGAGTIELEASSANANAFLTVENVVELEDGGKIEMASGGGDNAIFGGVASAELENVSDDISGTGTIYDITFINGGTVETNDSLGTGVLDIYGSATGGSFTNSSTGTVSADDGGTIVFGADGDNSLITNQGTIQLDSTGDATEVQIAGNVTINQNNGSSAPGFINMIGTNGDNSIVSDGNPATLTLVGGLLEGGGQLGDDNLTLINQATIQASNGLLTLNTGTNTITNEGEIGTNDGYLLIESPVNNSSGTIYVEDGSLGIYAPVSGNVGIGPGGTLAVVSEFTGLRLFVGSVSGNVEFPFAGTIGELVLNEDVANGGIGGEIEGAAAGDAIFIEAFNFEAGEHGVWQQTSASGGTLSIYDNGDDLYSLNLSGTYNTLDFAVGPASGLSLSSTATEITVQNTPSYAANPGNNDEWILSDGDWVESTDPGPSPTDPSGNPYQFAGIGDWTGNGTDGILWYDPNTGDVNEWQLANTQWSAGPDLGIHPANSTDGNSYQVAGVGDFFNAGNDDVLLTSTNSNGTIATDIWELNSGGTWLFSVSPGNHPAGYSVAGTGDWTGNGTDGILWFNSSTGDTDEWQLSGGQWAASVDLGAHPANADGNSYQIAGIGDFTDNGIDDVLWTSVNSNGTVATDIWELNSSGQWTASVSLGSHPAGYSVVGVGDFTGTGTSDVLWYNASTGDTDEWLINNGQWAGSIDLGTHPGGYQIVGVGDFNGDGIKDILWHASS